MSKYVICPGLALPCYPMRPRMGVRLTAANAVKEIEALHETHVFQPKMNGDRVLVAKLEGKVLAFNRHLRPYHFKFNHAPWKQLPDGSCLDGEVKDGAFHPFEMLALGGVSYLDLAVEDRIMGARAFTRSVGKPFLFFSVLDDGSSWGPGVGSEYLAKAGGNMPYWEGVVAKKKGSRYDILGAVVESPNWIKLKWENAP